MFLVVFSWKPLDRARFLCLRPKRSLSIIFCGSEFALRGELTHSGFFPYSFHGWKSQHIFMESFIIWLSLLLVVVRSLVLCQSASDVPERSTLPARTIPAVIGQSSQPPPLKKSNYVSATATVSSSVSWYPKRPSVFRPSTSTNDRATGTTTFSFHYWMVVRAMEAKVSSSPIPSPHDGLPEENLRQRQRDTLWGPVAVLVVDKMYKRELP